MSEGSAALSTNMKTANAGAQSVANGAIQLASGASQLNSGAGTLSTGLNTLQSSTGALVSGVEQLDSGAAELNSGMIQFNEEGIEKLVSVFDGDVDSLLDKQTNFWMHPRIQELLWNRRRNGRKRKIHFRE